MKINVILSCFLKYIKFLKKCYHFQFFEKLSIAATLFNITFFFKYLRVLSFVKLAVNEGKYAHS